MDIWYVSEFYKRSIIIALNFVVDLTGSTMPLVSGMGWKSPRPCLNIAACSVSSIDGLLLSKVTAAAVMFLVYHWGRTPGNNRDEWEVDVRLAGACRFPGPDWNKPLQGFGAPESGDLRLKSEQQHRWEREPFLLHSLMIGIESSPDEETVTHQMMAFLFEFQECVVILSGVIL